MPSAEVHRFVRLRPDLSAEPTATGELRLTIGSRCERIGPPPGGTGLGALAEGIPADPNPPRDPATAYWLDRLDRLAGLTRELRWRGETVARAVPLGTQPTAWGSTAEGGPRPALSPLVRVEAHGRGLRLRHALHPVAVELFDPGLLPVPAATPREHPAGRAVAALLRGANMLAGPDEPHPALDPLHLAAHRAARRGYDDAPRGKRADAPPRPPIAEFPTEAPLVHLPPPEPVGASLLDALAQRRSERSFAERAPTLAQLAAIAQACLRAHGGRRPHPSAGSRYPLQAFVVASPGRELPGGLYRYDADDHLLARVGDDTNAIAALLDEARGAMGCDRAPPVLLVLVAHFDRSTAAYGPLSYSLALTEAGAITMSVSLVATALGLASCPIGTGDSPRFSALAGLDLLRSDVVAALALGCPPD